LATVGTHAVTAVDYALDGAAAGNYSVSQPTLANASITKKPLTISGLASQDKVYNGDNVATLTGTAALVGVVAPDIVTITAGTASYALATVGTHAVTAVDYALDGAAAGNYSVSQPTLANASITKKPLTVTATGINKVYDGTTVATVTLSTDKLSGDYVTAAYTSAAFDDPNGSLVGTNKPITVNGITISGAQVGNYALQNETETTTANITQAPTSLDLRLSAGQVRYMDNITFTAVIKPDPYVSTNPLTGTVVFEIGTVSYTATVVPIPGSLIGEVQAMVITQLPASIDASTNTYTVTAKFASTNPNYASGSTDSEKLLIKQRTASPYNATGFYIGDGFAWTTGPNSSSATLTMVAAIRDSNIPTGDVRGAKVSFYFVNGTTLTAIPSAQNLPVGLVDVTDGSVGTASAIVQLNIGSSNSQAFQIAVKITGGYTNNPWDALSSTIVTVSKPITGGFITGGSNMTNQNSSGYIKGATGQNTDYQFDIQYTKSGTNPKGKVNITVRSLYDRNGILDSKLHTYLIRTNAIALLAISTPTATGTFSAKANMEEQLGNGTLVSVESGATFQMVAYQNSNTQKIAITYYRKAGGVWYASNWDAINAKSVLQSVNSGSTVFVAGGGGALTPDTKPTVETTSATSIVIGEAIIGGSVTNDGGAFVSERGVVYSLSNNTPTTSDIKVINGLGIGSYSTKITGLTSGETYYFRAYAINSEGTSYGATKIITDLKSASTEIAPVVTVEPTLRAYPNPFTERLTIEFSSANDTQAKLEIYSVTGAKLATLWDAPVTGGVLNKVEYVPNLVSSQMVFYHLTMDGKTQVGKVIYNERR